MNRRPNADDVTQARLWAEGNSGDDDPLLIMEWKLLESWRDYYGDMASMYERKQTETEQRMAEIEAEIETTGEEF